MCYETILLEKRGSIAIVSLNRPEKLNPLSSQMFGELSRAFDDLRLDDGVRAVVLTGKGRAFCAGGDVSELESGELCASTVLDARRSSKEFMLKLISFEKPLIGAVNGLAAGGGISLVLACDVVFASEKAAFSAIFRKIGIMPDCGALYLLQKAVGPARAKQLAFTGEIVGAQDMLRFGIAQEVVEGDALERACSFAEECAQGPALALGLSKMLIDRSYGMDIESFFDYESLALPLVTRSADFKEGVAAFLEKREASFGPSHMASEL